MIQAAIARYKRMRTERFLRQTYQYQYAFVGMGQHSLTNLYPVLHYLGVPLKYICVTSERKAKLIERKYPSVKATTSLDEILKDKAIKGVFVSASPSAHFSIASQVLRSGKSLFIEKPPCQTLEELDTLIALQQQYGIPEHSSPTRSLSPVAMVGLQKRYAPAVQLLKQRLRKEHLINYDLHYLTGAYPEGDAMLDLYIHPLDLVCYLFGQPKIFAYRQVDVSTPLSLRRGDGGEASYILMLQHPHIVGTLELSTEYTWTTAEESLKVCTRSGAYSLSQMEELTFSSKSSSLLGVPVEKIHPRRKTVEYLYTRNNFAPILSNNQVYSQGYFNEISAFVASVEDRTANVLLTSLQSVRDTYQLLSNIKNK
ncbi:MAG: Gfo/Idh/MocA family oxidoreductase [Prevotella sp.]|nr:Gfo/Idh/MocA family oxidoreductase [Prevotella sp.]